MAGRFVKAVTSVGLESINVELSRRGCRTGSAAGIVAAGAHVDVSIGDGRHCELNGIAGGIGGGHRAIPKIGGKGCRVVGMKDCGSASVGLGSAIVGDI